MGAMAMPGPTIKARTATQFAALAVAVAGGFWWALYPLGAILAIGNRFSLPRTHRRERQRR